MRRGHHVPLGLAVVALALHPEVVRQLVDELALVPVHALEAVLAAALLGVLGQPDQLGQPAVDHPGEGGVSPGEVLEELGVGRGLGAVVRVLNLERQGQSAVPFQLN